MKIQHLMALVVLSLLTVPGAWAAATTNTWTGADPSGFWSAPANWSPAGVPVNGNDLVFPGGLPPEDMVRYAGDGQFRITRARGQVEVDGTVISEILPPPAVTLSRVSPKTYLIGSISGQAICKARAK